MKDATRCPKCKGPSGMIRTRIDARGLYARRRRCLRCDFRWTTVEVTSEALPAIKPA